MRRVQRWTALLLAALCMLGTTQAMAEDELLERAQAMAAKLDRLADCQEYVAMMSGSEEITKQVAQWREHPHNELVAAYRMAIGQEQVDAMLTLGGVDAATLSQEIRGEMLKRLVTSAATMINARMGVAALAASSVLTTSAAFQAEDMTDAALYLLCYKEATPVMVSFCPGEEGVAAATVSYLAVDWTAEELDELMRPIRELLGELTMEEIELDAQK